MTNNMLFILKLILIILLNKTSAYITQNNIETIILPTWNSTDRKEVRVFYYTALFNLLFNDQASVEIIKSLLIVIQFSDTIHFESFWKTDSVKSTQERPGCIVCIQSMEA